jgi:tRNA/tmRNA/rRNA uracil-C5-methylase (TrmA/RlmC/RlmD family)
VDLILSDLPASTLEISGNRTTLIVDPPATGLGDTTRRAIIDIAPHTFIYVSCNPSTLARDLQDFAAGFTIESVTPLDMFPQTAEVEVVVHLQAQTR